MEKIDYFYLNQKTYKGLLKSFDDLLHTEKVKLNGFFASKEFALTHFFVRAFGDKPFGYSMSYEYSYNKYKDRVIADCEEYGFKVEGVETRISLEENYLDDKYIGGLQTKMSVGYEDRRRKQLLYEALAAQGRDMKSFAHELVLLFYAINLVIMTLPHKVKQSEEKETHTIETKKNGGKTYKSVVYLKHTYSLEDNFKLTKSDIKHIIKCPAWGVRGHKRHLKSGKVIYIKPFVKGKYRNDASKYVAKEYKIDIE